MNSDKILDKIVRFTQMRYMRVLMDGFMSVAALTIAGSIFTLVKSLPIPVWQSFLTSSGFGDILSIPVSATSDLMAVWIALGMGSAVSKEFNKDKLSCALMGLGTFMLLTPFSATVYSADYTSSTVVPNVISVGSLGAQGIFLAMLAGILGSRLYIFFLDKGWKIKMPESVPQNVSGMFEMMLPAGLTFLVFLAARVGISMTPFGTAQNLIYGVLQAPLMSIGGGVAGVFVFLLVGKLLWVFGVHGSMVAYSAMAAIIGTAQAANAAAFAAGTPAPYPEWCYAFLFMDFAIFPLCLVMITTAKSQQYKALAKIALPTSFFNISEPLVFGMPLVMNPILAVPFVLIQPLDFALTLLVNKIGLVAGPTGAGINNFLPTIFQLPMLTAHWSGLVWAVVLIVLDYFLWLPFFKMADKRVCQQEAAEAAAAEA